MDIIAISLFMKISFHRSHFPFLVFCTGASVMILETVATRILAPYFGNTLYTFSGIITVVLASLSLGYYMGGIIADTAPSNKIFFIVIAAGGIGVLLCDLLTSVLLPIIGYLLPMSVGPIVVSFVLFSLPSFLLGIVSPIAIVMQNDICNHKVGNASGSIFFWSTIGSIVGTLIASFLLIPLFGTHLILILCGLFLIGLASVNLFQARQNHFLLLKILAISILLALISIAAHSSKKNVYTKDGKYSAIFVRDAKRNGRDARYLTLDRSLSGAVYLDNPDDLVFDYMRFYELYKLSADTLDNILLLGGGAYSLPNILLSEQSNSRIDIAEIEPSLLPIAKRFFRFQDHPRISNYTEDGRRFLAQQEKKYDLIFSDMYGSSHTPPFHVATMEFFHLTKERLTPRGVIIINIAGSLDPRPPSFLWSEIKTFQSIFPQSYFFCVESVDSTKPQNIMFVGYNSDAPINIFEHMDQKLQNPYFSNLSTKKIDLNKIDLSQHTVLSDDHSPVEYLSTYLIKQL